MLTNENAPYKDKDHKSFHVDKIENGYLVSTCGMDEQERVFTENLLSVPQVIARLMGDKAKGMGPEELKKNFKFKFNHKEEGADAKEKETEA